MNPKLEELKQRQSKLQFHMESAIKERDAIKLELDKMLPKVVEQFGTANVDELRAVSEDLQTSIDESIAKLASLGVNI